MSTSELSQVCAELVERWDDVSLDFGTHHPTVSTEFTAGPTFDVHIFEDCFSRPRFAVLKHLLSISKFDFPCPWHMLVGGLRYRLRVLFKLFLQLGD